MRHNTCLRLLLEMATSSQGCAEAAKCRSTQRNPEALAWFMTDQGKTMHSYCAICCAVSSRDIAPSLGDESETVKPGDGNLGVSAASSSSTTGPIPTCFKIAYT